MHAEAQQVTTGDAINGERVDARRIMQAIHADAPDEQDLAVLLAPETAAFIEPLAQRAATVTRQYFGRAIALYAPLYLSNYCSSGCTYCGYAADRTVPRRRLEPEEMRREMDALHAMGIDDVLLLTGERTAKADVDYVRAGVAMAAERFHRVAVEVFPMTQPEYALLVAAGCTGVTLYQETYDRDVYARLHRWGPKRDFDARRAAPGVALAAGMRSAGLGVLLGLSEPRADLLALYRHVRELQRRHWQAAVTVSFPRVRPQTGEFQPDWIVDEPFLARIIMAFRICLPTVHLLLSTRERATFRDGMAGIGVSRMSVASRTTVGGYATAVPEDSGQFEVSDNRDIDSFSRALRAKDLWPVLKDWDRTYGGEGDTGP